MRTMQKTLKSPKPYTTKCTQGKCRRRSVVSVAATGERYCGTCWQESPESKPRKPKKKTVSKKRKVKVKR